uniref:Uncharacterized protein n=1 Tax=Mus spicilegus TaxID=10103 RepID=A0A8C6GBH1_MUSSI
MQEDICYCSGKQQQYRELNRRPLCVCMCVCVCVYVCPQEISKAWIGEISSQAQGLVGFQDKLRDWWDFKIRDWRVLIGFQTWKWARTFNLTLTDGNIR